MSYSLRSIKMKIEIHIELKQLVWGLANSVWLVPASPLLRLRRVADLALSTRMSPTCKNRPAGNLNHNTCFDGCVNGGQLSLILYWFVFCLNYKLVIVNPGNQCSILVSFSFLYMNFNTIIKNYISFHCYWDFCTIYKSVS